MIDMLSPKTFAFQAALALTLALAPAASLLAAETPQYTVEVIIFKNLTGDPSGAEIWTRANQEPLPEADLDLPEAVTQPEPTPAVEYTLLKENELGLRQLAQRLEASQRYEVLLHQAWRQPGLERDKAAPMHIEVPLESIAPAPAPSAEPSLFEDGMSSDWARPEARLEGKLKLILSRYLHLETDLRYYTGELLQPMDAAQDEFAELVTQPQVYRLKQERRMRSGELHYLDHPAFGLLAVVKPYEAEGR